jgi:hypothetical protein
LSSRPAGVKRNDPECSIAALGREQPNDSCIFCLKEGKMIVRLLASLLAVSLWLPAALPAQTKCKLSTAWSATSFDEKECLEHAEKAMRKTGYYKNFSITGQSVFGYNEEDEHASVRCITSKGLVFFVVSGSGASSDRVERIKRNY